MKIGRFLLRRLHEVGVRHLFGAPGDYNLEFMQQLEEDECLAWVGNCNELIGADAADGYARLHGLGAMVVTHGAGALSALNGIAARTANTRRLSASAERRRSNPAIAAC